MKLQKGSIIRFSPEGCYWRVLGTDKGEGVGVRNMTTGKVKHVKRFAYSLVTDPVEIIAARKEEELYFKTCQ